MPEPYVPTERRPIASRSWTIWNSVVPWLVKRGITANQISVMGMLAGLAGGICFAATTWTGPFERVWWLLAAACIQGRLLANLLDGMVAIESKKASPVGELYNEVPDRVSDSAIMIGAGFAVGSDPILGFAASLTAMFTAYVRAQGKAAGAKQFYVGPMAKQQRMALLTIGAIVMTVFGSTWSIVWRSRGLMAFILAVITVLALLTAWRRLYLIAANLRETKAHNVPS